MNAALSLLDLRKNFGPVQIIRGVSLDIAEGERHAIIGPNGAGKSTLFNLISGRIRPSSGEVRLHGQPITGLSPFEINRRGLSRSFQITNIFPKMSVEENCAALRCGRSATDTRSGLRSNGSTTSANVRNG
jgi:branched-chain amino acid transport system ATP-binding protein